MSPVSDTQIVALRGGLTVPVAALRVLCELEARDFDVRLASDGALLVVPGSRLTADDRAAIAEHRDALRHLVTYCAGQNADLVA